MISPGALHEATVVAQRSADLAHTAWDHLDAAVAVEAVEAICAAKSLLDAALLRGIERIEATHALHDLGWTSTRDWLTHLLGAHKGTGGGLVRAVEQLRDLPAVQTALDDGHITLPQARAIAGKVHTLPRVPQFREAVAGRMLELVADHGHDASGLQTSFADVVRELDPDAAIVNTDKERAKRERGAHNARHLSFTEDGLGGIKLKGYGSVEDAEKIKTTLFPLSAPVTTEPGACGGVSREPGQSMFDDDGNPTATPCPTPGCAHDGTDPRDGGKRMWDALVDACDQLHATDTLPRDHGTRPRVIVLIDHESLKQKVIDAGYAREGHTPTGARLSATAIRRIACDADIIPSILGAQGQILDIGRAQRLVTTALWMALIIRDRHCAFPGCSRLPLACDAHHIVHWADGGTTDLDNMVMLCRHHHTLIHHSPWTVHIDPDTRKPVWTPPPRLTLNRLRKHATYHPGGSRAA